MRRLPAIFVVGALLVPMPARAQTPTPEEASVSPLASGSPLERALRPDLGPREVKACSFKHALCVHAAPGAPAFTVLGVLASADRSWDTLTGSLGLPAPDVDVSTGAFDVFVVGGPEFGGADADLDRRDPLARYDRASAFALVDAR